MNLPLQNNWQFLLASSLRRGEWFIDRDIILENADVINTLFNSKFQQVDRLPYPLILSDAYGYYSEAQKDGVEKEGVAVFPLKGVMLKNGTYCSYGTIEIEQFMRRFASDE
ncbi:MAG: hypothetical protein LBB53_00175, partial [Prevotellaceae bacterium]|nr:hypothetical protein [Prevotellaceae bacterium]